MPGRRAPARPILRRGTCEGADHFPPMCSVAALVGSPVAFHAIQTVGIVPPSMTYSLPVMEEARSDAKNAVAHALVDVAPAGRLFCDPPESIQAPCDGT